MTKFNPQNKETLTYGECLNPAMAITEKDDALQYKSAYIDFIEKDLQRTGNPNGLTALEIANKNLGYYAGYGSNELRQRVESLFDCSHPIFGSVVDNGIPSNEDAFNAGLKAYKTD